MKALIKSGTTAIFTSTKGHTEQVINGEIPHWALSTTTFDNETPCTILDRVVSKDGLNQRFLAECVLPREKVLVEVQDVTPDITNSKYGELETYVDMAALFYGAGCSTGDSRRDVEVIINEAALFNLRYFGEDWTQVEYMDAIEAWFERYSGLLDLYGKE